MIKVSGQYDTEGNYNPYVSPVEVYRFGNTLRDEDGMVWAILDDYDDWVSPTLRSIGIKAKVKVEGKE